MSLYIETDKVDAVLLADGWHKVKPGTFDLDSYEYHHDNLVNLGGGQEKLVSATGFVFIEVPGGATVYGPLTSVLAVRS